MQITCKNCSHKFKGKFCNFCGQSAHTHNITFQTMWHDFQHHVLHIDSGFFYTIYQLFTRPGHAIREFLEGKRVKHYKPIALVFILAAIYAFLYHYFDLNLGFNIKPSAENPENSTSVFEKIDKWMNNNYSLVSILQLPVSTLSTFFIFRKSGYNFAELFVFNSFLLAQELFIGIVLFPITYFFNGTDIADYLNEVVVFGFGLWAYVQFFTKEPPKRIFFKFLLDFIINYAMILILSILIFILILLSTGNTHFVGNISF